MVEDASCTDNTNNQKKDDAKQQNEHVDLVNYKGIYHDDETEKFQDTDTGAHFRHNDIVKRLFVAQEERKILDLKLGIFYNNITESSSNITGHMNAYSSDQIPAEDTFGTEGGYQPNLGQVVEIEDSSKIDASDSPVRNELE